MTLQEVLAHPAVQPSRPLLLAGDPSRREVRWVHSSDIFDIAPLLRGGELLLTTGLGLAGAGPEQRRAYVRALAEREVAGLALELSTTFDAVPSDMVEQARALQLPFIALQRIHPFVEVTEAINSALLDSSITRLRYADDIGRALSLVVAERGGLDSLTARLAQLVRRPVVLTDASEEVLAAAGAEDQAAVLAAPAATANVLSDGVLLGRLHLGQGSSADDLLRAAVDRAPEIVAIEVLRGRSRALLAGRELRHLLVRLLEDASGAAASLTARAASSRIAPDCRWVGLAVAPTHGHAGLGLVQDAARESGTRTLAAEVDGATCALVAVPAGSADGLHRLGAALDRPTGPVVALGPVTDADGAGRSLRAARSTLALAGQPGLGRRLLVAEELVVQRVLHAVPDASVLTDLVEEQLGGLLRAPHAETLLATLDCYVASGCSKAATARELHLRRQSVHLRLSRASGHLGYDVSDPRRLPALSLALAARRAGRS